jgi:hypothetical protein
MKGGEQQMRRREKSRGVAVLELAISLVFLVPLLMVMLDFGYYFYIGVNAEEAARAGVRQAVLFPGAVNCAAGGPAIIAGQRSATGIGNLCNGGAASCYMNEPPLNMGTPPNTNVTVTCLTAPVDPTWQVQVQVDFLPMIGFLKAVMRPGSGGKVRYTATITN